MRRSLSLVLVAAMLLSAMVFVVPTASAAAETEPKLDWGNSYATAYYYGGTVDFYRITGKENDRPEKVTAVLEEEEIGRKDPTTNDKIKLDGKIEEGEWGKVSLSVSSDYAGKFSGKNGQRNPDIDEPSKDNAYYFTNFKTQTSTTKYYDMQFDAYFLWDEEFFYMAVDVLDVDGFSNGKKSGTEGAWNGDAIQFRIDPDGPNSIVNGEGYDAKVDPRPWKRSEMKNGYQERYAEIPNFIVALTKPVDKKVNGSMKPFVDCWDAAKRYNVTTDEEGKLVGQEQDISQGVFFEETSWNPAYAAVTTQFVGGGPIDQNTRTQYEVAIPWAYMDSAAELIASEEFFSPKAGMQLGMALTLMNGARGEDGYKSSLSWGNGVTGDAAYHHYEVDGGSNCLVLDDTPFREADICEHETFAEPTCENGYKCTNCGYEKGFSLGHSFEYSKASLPTADATGSITGTCTRAGCGVTVRRTLSKTVFEEVGSFKSTDTNLTMMPAPFDSDNVESGRSGWTKMWVDSNGISYKDPATGESRNAYEILNGEAVVNLTNLNYTGTAFYGDTLDDLLSFSQSMDVYMTGYSFPKEGDPADANTNNMVGESGYTSGIYTTYGGNEKNGYNGGLFYIPEDDQYYFALIRANRDENSKVHNCEQFEKWALAYKKVSKEEAASFMNNWHNLKVVYDDTTQTGFVFWDGELQVAGFVPLSKHARNDNKNSIVMRTFDVQFYAKNVVWERLKSGDPIPDVITRPGEQGDEYTLTLDGVEYQMQVGEQLPLSGTFTVSKGYAYRFEAWACDVDGCIEDVNAAETTFTMPAQDVTVTTQRYLVGDVNGNGLLDIGDAAMVAQMAAGVIPETPVADILGDGYVTTGTLAYFGRYIVGTYIPTK